MNSIWILDIKWIVGVTTAVTKSIKQLYFQTRLTFSISTAATMSGGVLMLETASPHILIVCRAWME
jgi:hypothetical protein